MTLSVCQQTRIMRRAWPDFQLLDRTRTMALWEGPLRPLSRAYTVRVRLHQDPRLEREQEPPVPEVTVIDPLLRHRAECPEEPIPHHYPNCEAPDLPLLCLCDPAAHEWRYGLRVADTIIPWTIDWLACYEMWLATGAWVGGGRDHEVQ